MKKPKTITYDDAMRISNYLSGQSKLIFDFSVESGLRISDILNLKARYINKIIYVQESKTKKHKIVELSDGLFSRLRELANHESRDQYAFHSRRSLYKPIHRSTYHRHLKRACRALGVDFSAHSTRKLYALHIFNTTGDIFEAQKALNHKYITTTCSYLDIDLVKLLSTQAQKTLP